MKKALLILFLLIVAVLGFDIAASAEGGVTTGPRVTLDVAQGAIGEPVWITVSGFDTSWVTISFCGNEARRGSPDCNMLASEGAEVAIETPLVRQLFIAEPPMPCPCVVRVADRTNTIVANATLDILGHPTGKVVGGYEAPGGGIAVSVRAVPVSSTAMSWLRGELGGESEYDVTVRVRNDSVVELSNLRLAGSAGRSAENDLLELPLDDPGTLAAGETWEQTIRTTAPPASFDNLEWRVFVSGVGPTVVASDSTSRSPRLLAVLAVSFVVLIGAVLVRWRVRVHYRRSLAVSGSTV